MSAVNLRRGCLRLGMVFAMLWLLYWSFAYIFKPQPSENLSSPPGPELSATAIIVLTGAAILGLWWIVSGVRSN